MKILILGGYGTFGGRLARVLLNYPSITLLIAGRSFSKANEFCQQLDPDRAIPLAFSRDENIELVLKKHQVQLLVDASGPFQAYGDDPYQLARQCIAAGINYLDFADGAEFAQGIKELDTLARAANVWALSGVSSFPVLTAAVVRRMMKDSGLQPQKVLAGIAPSPYAGFGLNVVKAIALYAGRKIPIVNHGKICSAHALTQTLRRTVSVPGQLPLNHRLFALVEVPDLLVLKTEHPGLQDVWVGAAPVPELLLRCLVLMAWAVRWRLLPPLAFAAPLFHAAINLFRWGEHRGGMFVEVHWQSSGGASHYSSWHMLAEADDGPYIPCLAIEAIVSRQLAGKIIDAGARAATNDVELEEYESLFAQRSITTGMRSQNQGHGLYQQILGEAWARLPIPIQQLHENQASMILQGQAKVMRGKGLLSRCLARLAGFPGEGKAVALVVEIERTSKKERWTRDFGGHRFSSELSAGQGHHEHLLTEKIAGLSFDIALVLQEQSLNWHIRSWRWGKFRLPLSWAPTCEAREAVHQGIYTFNVKLSHTLCGLLVAYQGTLNLPSKSPD